MIQTPASPQGFHARLPKIHLHCHILGMVRAQTVIDLANANNVHIATRDPGELYKYYDFRSFIDILTQVAAVMRTEADFSRVMYEAVAEDFQTSRVLYSEIFVQAAAHMMFGVPYEVIICGYEDGVRRAEREFGIRVRLIESVNRTLPPFYALEMVRKLLARKPDYFIGIGLEDFELAAPPGLFEPAFDLARAAGLHRTAHAGEHGPAQNIISTLVELHCERIDHGYQAITDPSICYRLADNGIHFTACPTVSSRQGWARPEGHVLKRMHEAGLWLSINADDPAIIQTTLAREYALAQHFMGLTERELAALSLRAIDATWLPPTEKRSLRQRFLQEFRQLPEISAALFE